jgi:hypothetical protein
MPPGLIRLLWKTFLQWFFLVNLPMAMQAKHLWEPKKLTTSILSAGATDMGAFVDGPEFVAVEVFSAPKLFFLKKRPRLTKTISVMKTIVLFIETS